MMMALIFWNGITVKLMDVSSDKAYSDHPFNSPASFNVISIADIHFAYISYC